MSTALVWFRQDLRLADNPALWEACRTCDQVIPVFIDDPAPATTSQLGAASRVWLHHSLLSLDESLRACGSRLLLRQGSALAVLQQLVAEAGVTHVFWNRCYDPVSLPRDKRIKACLKEHVEVSSFNGSLLREPWEALKADGTPYKVFTPFWNMQLKQGIQAPVLPAPSLIPAPVTWPDGLTVSGLDLLPRLSWHLDMMAHWQAGEQAAMRSLHAFLPKAAAYKTDRDFPARPATSRLSPHLHWGEISPRQMVYFAQDWLEQHPGAETGVRHFLQEVGWREFAWHLLFHFPHTLDEPLDERFRHVQWAQDYEPALARWQRGQTGIPIIDAGMRELWQTGWMHNRVRMIVASWLSKNLLIPWQEGERWFRDTLVDADLANNALGWQWVAGCGADAAPYFRVFNPVLQAEKFDPHGDYIRAWVPELATRTDKDIHRPRERGDGLTDYPLPMADLKVSRERALECFSAVKQFSGK